ncbi:MAG: hypothetical protein J0M02_01055 [Planctomycetes bacterium]|nr:hypothetical protein [Planctomycetota bacterium]
MQIDRPRTAWPWARALPASLTHEQVRDLHALSKISGRTIRRIVTTAVTAALDEAREAESNPA